jgi:hypothetical protein
VTGAEEYGLWQNDLAALQEADHLFGTVSYVLCVRHGLPVAATFSKVSPPRDQTLNTQ